MPSVKISVLRDDAKQMNIKSNKVYWIITCSELGSSIERSGKWTWSPNWCVIYIQTSDLTNVKFQNAKVGSPAVRRWTESPVLWPVGILHNGHPSAMRHTVANRHECGLSQGSRSVYATSTLSGSYPRYPIGSYHTLPASEWKHSRSPCY